MKSLYLVLALLGLVVPYYFLISFVLTYGPDVAFFFKALFQTSASTFFVADVALASVVFLAFSYAEAKRCKMPNWWAYVVTTILIGPSFSIPLFLFFRECRFAPVDMETIGMGVRIGVKERGR